MSLKNDRYTYRVTWSEDDNEYVGLCAEFPSLSWLAKTPEAALKGIRKVPLYNRSIEATSEIVGIHDSKTVFVRFIGTHREY
jgi:hypothetical protein